MIYIHKRHCQDPGVHSVHAGACKSSFSGGLAVARRAAAAAGGARAGGLSSANLIAVCAFEHALFEISK